MDYKLSEESAKEQLDLFFQYYDVDPDLLGLYKDRIIRKILLGLRLGKVEIVLEEGLKIIQYFGKEKIEYSQITVFIREELEKYEDGIKKVYAILRMLSKEDKTTFQKMVDLDVLIAECIGALFLIL